MKAYTDVKQSKKLVEILPLESADMHYATWTILNGEFIVYPNQGSTIEDLQEDYGNQIIPCWSLAKLIEILPNKIVVNNENYFLNFTKNSVEYRGIVTCDGQKCVSTKAENLLDACYNIIVKLKKDVNYIFVVTEKDK